MLVVVSLELQVFHEISWIYENSQDCLENSLNPKLVPKFPRSWENSQAVAALVVAGFTASSTSSAVNEAFRTRRHLRDEAHQTTSVSVGFHSLNGSPSSTGVHDAPFPSETRPQSNLRRARRKCPTGYNGMPEIPPKTAHFLRRSPPPSNTPIPRPTPLTTQTASGSNQPFCYSSLLRTDRWDKRMFCAISAPLAMLIESDALKLLYTTSL